MRTFILLISGSFAVLSAPFISAQAHYEKSQGISPAPAQTSAKPTEKPRPSTRSEFGVGLSGLHLPDYIGSNKSSNRLLPFPHIRLNNQYVEVDRGEARGKLFNSKRLDFSISFSGSLPLNSEDNALRRDMPDLDTIAEVGPALRIKLINSTTDNITKLYLEAPFRAAFSLSGKKLGHVGWRWGLNLAYQYDWRNWQVSHRLGVDFSDSRFHNYIYGVDAAYATETRPDYNSNSGFTTSRISSGVSRKIGNWWYGGFLSYYSLAGSEIKNSPLTNSDNAFAVGVAIARIFNRKE